MNFNTLFQLDTLLSDNSSIYPAIDKILFMPDALSYLLGVGSLRQYSVPFKSDVHLDTFRNYNLRIIHLMGDDPLRGVDKIGIRIL